MLNNHGAQFNQLFIDLLGFSFAFEPGCLQNSKGGVFQFFNLDKQSN